MGAFDSSPGRWDPAPEGDPSVGGLSERFVGLDVGDSSNRTIVQVMRAVEDAENTIKQQLEENAQLRDELLRKTEELQKIKMNTESPLRSPSVSAFGGSLKSGISPLELETHRIKGGSSLVDPLNKLVIHQNGVPKSDLTSLRGSSGSQVYSEKCRGNGPVTSSPGVTQYSPPSSRSISPSRHHKEGESDDRMHPAVHGQMQTSQGNGTNSLWKQELILKVKDHEEEILQLKSLLADYSVKEAHICNEKYVLEKRIAHMRMAFDQQQQDLVDAASKAISYRQDIIEENIRLTYALQSAQQERSTYVSSLLPLLSEYDLQPSVPDAFSIVSNLKVLFKHLHEKLATTEEKLKVSQYQITPWHAEASNALNFVPQSPSDSAGAAPTSNKVGLELVAQPPYSHSYSPMASPSMAPTRTDWEVLGQPNLQPSSGGFMARSPNFYEVGRSSPSVDRNFATEDAPARVPVTQDDPGGAHFSSETKDASLFKESTRGNEMDDPDAIQHARESSMHWGPSNSYLASGMEDPNAGYPYLSPVLEEPNSSFSEVAEDDPLPAIESLQISGEAYPGRELQACGYSTNGTTTCNFEWVRYLEDGSVNFIDGAKQPAYLVTADDVDCYLAIEVQPLDNRKRKGELVKVFANDQKKIACDAEMQEQIERILSVGHTSFEVSISAGVINIWEHAVLAIKTEGYSIKCHGPRGIVVTEKFSPNTEVIIPYGQPTEFSIQSSSEVEHLLRSANSSLRDIIVLTLRLFKIRAVERRKGRRKGLFFK